MVGGRGGGDGAPSKNFREAEPTALFVLTTTSDPMVLSTKVHMLSTGKTLTCLLPKINRNSSLESEKKKKKTFWWSSMCPDHPTP